MKRKKRVSNIVKFCSKHGKFVGFTWGGHRKHCQAPEVTEAQWYAKLKPAGNETPLVSNPARLIALPKIKKGIRTELEKIATRSHRTGEKLQKVVPGPGSWHDGKGMSSAPDKLLGDIKNYLFDLDKEIEHLNRVKTDAEKKWNDLVDERDNIKTALKNLV